MLATVHQDSAPEHVSASQPAPLGGADAEAVAPRFDDDGSSMNCLPEGRPALALSLTAFALVLPTSCGTPIPSGADMAFPAPAMLIPAPSPPLERRTNHQRAAANQPPPSSDGPQTPLIAADLPTWPTTAWDSVQSPVPWQADTRLPGAPHLSEDKGAFSPLPLTPGDVGDSVFARMQDEYLSTVAVAPSYWPGWPVPGDLGAPTILWET